MKHDPWAQPSSLEFAGNAADVVFAGAGPAGWHFPKPGSLRRSYYSNTNTLGLARDVYASTIFIPFLDLCRYLHLRAEYSANGTQDDDSCGFKLAAAAQTFCLS